MTLSLHNSTLLLFLLLLSCYFESKCLGRQVLECRVDETDGPTSGELAEATVTIRNEAILLTCHLHIAVADECLLSISW